MLEMRHQGSSEVKPLGFTPTLHDGHNGSGKLTHDSSVFFGANVRIDLCADVIVGKQVIIGNDCEIIRHDHNLGRERTQVAARSPLIIREGAYIGCHTIILESCHEIGAWSVIGAGSVVTKDVAPYVIVAGNPARIIGDVKLE